MTDLENREAFNAWIVKHPDSLDLNSYEKGIMFDAWQAAKAQAIPDGYKVVPKEPTQEMLDAFPEVEYEDTYAGACSILIDSQTLKIGYKAMIEAQEPAND